MGQPLDHPLDSGVVQLHITALDDVLLPGDEDLVTLREADGQRLLAEDVHSGMQGGDDGVAMRGVGYDAHSVTAEPGPVQHGTRRPRRDGSRRRRSAWGSQAASVNDSIIVSTSRAATPWHPLASASET